MRKYRSWTPEEIGQANEARMILSRALQNGKIIRPSVCSVCGKVCEPQGHHDDYSKPLEVRWLCRKPCHARADAEMRQRLRAPLRTY